MTHIVPLRLIQASILSRPTSLVVRSTSPFHHQEGSVRRNQAQPLCHRDSNQCTPALGLHDPVLLQCLRSCNHHLHPWGSISLIHPNLMHRYRHYSNTIHSLVPSRHLHHPHLVLYRHRQGHPNHNMPPHRRRPHTRSMCPNNRVGSKSLVRMAGDLFLNNPDRRIYACRISRQSRSPTLQYNITLILLLRLCPFLLWHLDLLLLVHPRHYNLNGPIRYRKGLSRVTSSSSSNKCHCNSHRWSRVLRRIKYSHRYIIQTRLPIARSTPAAAICAERPSTSIRAERDVYLHTTRASTRPIQRDEPNPAVAEPALSSQLPLVTIPTADQDTIAWSATSTAKKGECRK
jgi:hypothetical protein